MSDGAALSEPFPVQRGVAQGCPLSPLLYAVFIDSVLDHLYSTNLPEGDAILVGAGTARRRWAGQLYADDLSAGAATARGLQCLIDAVRAHSRCWGWTLTVPKSHVVVFGGAAARGCGAQFSWGGSPVARRPSERYLGVHLDERGTWELQAQAAADKGRRAV